MRGYKRSISANITDAYGKKKDFFQSDIFIKKCIIAFQ